MIVATPYQPVSIQHPLTTGISYPLFSGCWWSGSPTIVMFPGHISTQHEKAIEVNNQPSPRVNRTYGIIFRSVSGQRMCTQISRISGPIGNQQSLPVSTADVTWSQPARTNSIGGCWRLLGCRLTIGKVDNHSCFYWTLQSETPEDNR